MRAGNLLFWTNFSPESGEKVEIPVEIIGKKKFNGETLLLITFLHKPACFWTTLQDAEEKTRTRINLRGLPKY